MLARASVICILAVSSSVCLSRARAQAAPASPAPSAQGAAATTPASAAPPQSPESDVTYFGWYPVNGALRVEGVQLGFWNIARELRGVQLSYGCLQIAADVMGAQIGFGWQGAQSVDGLQLGMFTVANTVRGVQVGLVNYTKGPMSGLQLGLVNISHGTPLAIGLVNWAVNGRTDLMGGASSSGFVGGVLRNGGAYHHNIYAVDYHVQSKGVRLGLGLGLHADMGPATLDLDAIVYSFSEPTMEGQPPRPQLQGEAVVWFGVKLGDKAILTLGSGVALMRGDADPSQFDHGIAWHGRANSSGTRVSLWPTLHLGLRWVFQTGEEPPSAADPTTPPT